MYIGKNHALDLTPWLPLLINTLLTSVFRIICRYDQESGPLESLTEPMVMLESRKSNAFIRDYKHTVKTFIWSALN